MKPILKKALKGGLGLLGALLVGGGCFVSYDVYAFNASVDKVYAVPVPAVERSTDPSVLERGRHLAQSIAPCTDSNCHSPDLGGGVVVELGPLGRFAGPNISAGGLGAAYSDGELFRLVRHGLKKDGRTLRFMPAHEFNWLSDADITATISYLRTLPAVPKTNNASEFSPLAKVLDRRGMIPVDIARRIDHDHIELGPAPAPNAGYGRFLGRLCSGCHGEHLSGGPIPGAPPDFPVPPNLTPDATGMKSWSYDDFERAMSTGMRKDGKPIDKMMPIATYKNFDETEKHALWAYLQSLPPLAFGGR